jgi:hypothetical protein
LSPLISSLNDTFFSIIPDFDAKMHPTSM